MRALALLWEARNGLIPFELTEGELQLAATCTYRAFFRVHSPAMGTASHE
jgi:hypothetical protein